MRVAGSRSQRGLKISRDIVMVSLGAVISLSCASVVWTFGSLLSAGRVPVPDEHSATPYRTAGWNPVHVFYGKMNHLIDPIPEARWIKHSPRHPKGGKWFSQHGQDIAIAKVFGFKSSGFFVDLAANDAVWASNSFALEQNFGW